jgi:UDP-glucuronate 4-epimerase
MGPGPTLATGAAGFIGFHVASAMLAKSQPVVGVDNLTSYYDPNLKEARLSELKQRNGFRLIKLG